NTISSYPLPGFRLVTDRDDCHKRYFATNRRSKMVKAAAILFGLVFLIVGILGFVPAVTSNEMLLGIFHVNFAHNIVHLASGAVFLLCGMSGPGPSRTFFKIFGIVYALVASLGFYYGDHTI